MVSIRLNEIPDGLSEEERLLGPEDLEIEHSGVKQIRLQLRFHKQEDNLRIKCHMVSQANFICDRSLDTFETELESDYEVVFQQNVEDEREELSGTLRRLDTSRNTFDITREIRDSVLLSIPVKKLHPRYYKNGEVTGFEARFGIDDEESDPRWDALRKLKQELPKN